jgi:hypothetical protein
MRNSRTILLLCLALACGAFAHGREASRPVPSEKPSGGWQEHGEMNCSFGSARVRMITRFEGRGFQLKHEIPLGHRGDRCLMLWESPERKFLVMMWRLDVDRTGFSIGEFKDDK